MSVSFVTGGPVRHDSPFYVTRDFEDKVFETVRSHQYLTLVGSRQVGKTSLLQKIQATVEEHYGYASALIDLSTFNDDAAGWRDWVSIFCARLEQQLSVFAGGDLDLPIPEDGGMLPDYWQALARRIEAPTILVLLDEAAAVPRRVRDLFYSTIRWMFTDRTAHRPTSELARFNFVFAGMFEPARLIKDRRNSPFNVSRTERLADFSRAEVVELVAHRAPGEQNRLPEPVAEVIYLWTGGHPFLTQTLAKQVSRRAERTAEAPAAAWLQEEIEELFDRAGDNIDPVMERALESEAQVDLLRDILGGRRVPFSRHRSTISSLEMVGAIRKAGDGHCEIRNRVYELALRRAVDLPTIVETAGDDVASAPRDHIFISYARKDNQSQNRWLDLVLEHLKPLASHHQIAAWSDQDLEVGQRWNEEILDSLQRTRAAVLLVSPAFLASDFIREQEMPVLLQLHAENRIDILPLLIHPCLLETPYRYPDPANGPHQLALSELQTAGAEEKALSELSEAERNRKLLDVARRLRKLLRPESD